MTQTSPAVDTATTFLAWTTPALRDDPDAQLAERSILQCLALAAQYAAAHVNQPVAETWAAALGQLPLIGTSSQNSLSQADATFEVLTTALIEELSTLAGAGPAGVRALDALAPPLVGVGRRNIVQTVVGRFDGTVTATIVHVQLDCTEKVAPPPPPAPSTWSMSRVTSTLELDYQRLKSPSVRSSWDELMGHVDPAAITSQPGYHALSL